MKTFFTSLHHHANAVWLSTIHCWKFTLTSSQQPTEQWALSKLSAPMANCCRLIQYIVWEKNLQSSRSSSREMTPNRTRSGIGNREEQPYQFNIYRRRRVRVVVSGREYNADDICSLCFLLSIQIRQWCYTRSSNLIALKFVGTSTHFKLRNYLLIHLWKVVERELKVSNSTSWLFLLRHSLLRRITRRWMILRKPEMVGFELLLCFFFNINQYH